MSAGRVTPLLFLPCAAFVVAVWASMPAIDIWSHVADGTMYDPWRDQYTHSAPLIAVGLAILASILALFCLKSYRKFALVVLVWAVLAVSMVPVGLSVVKVLPDG